MEDRFNLERFKQAQEYTYPIALGEIRAGRKQSHWMWYIFPQLSGLADCPSEMTGRFAISGREEARAYIDDELLRWRLIEISAALTELPPCPISSVMSFPDDLKLRSCMTLFAIVAPEWDVFKRVLDRYFGGRMDEKTCRLLGEN